MDDGGGKRREIVENLMEERGWEGREGNRRGGEMRGGGEVKEHWIK